MLKIPLLFIIIWFNSCGINQEQLTLKQQFISLTADSRQFKEFYTVKSKIFFLVNDQIKHEDAFWSSELKCEVVVVDQSEISGSEYLVIADFTVIENVGRLQLSNPQKKLMYNVSFTKNEKGIWFVENTEIVDDN